MDMSICGPLCLRIFDPFPISQPADSHLVVAVELKLEAETAKFAGLPWPWAKPWCQRLIRNRQVGEHKSNFTMAHDTKISIVHGDYKLYIYIFILYPYMPFAFLVSQ